MAEANQKRSQAILRLPVDIVDVVMILHDGERAEVQLHIPPGEQLATLLADGNRFLPVIRPGGTCLVARDAIAALAAPVARAPRLDPDLPMQRQRAVIRLRSGVRIEGELRWVAPPGRQRTTDHLNGDAPYVVVYGDDTAHLIVKAHVTEVIEQ